MAEQDLTPAIEDKNADRRAYMVVIAVLLVSMVTQATTRQIEVARLHINQSTLEVWLLEGSSHAAILVLLPLIPRVLTWAPIQSDRWWETALKHIGACLVFSLAHVCLMYAARLALFPALLGFKYNVSLLAPLNLLYELRKDVLSYIVLVFAFYSFRSIEYRKAETQAALQSARTEHRLTLKSGGDVYFVQADAIISARAAANYVEVVTADKTYLTRMTLTKLERLLLESGNRHVRVHRSHLVNLDHVTEIVPTGDGAVLIRLSDGTEVPGGRRYRDRLPLESVD